MPSAVQIPHTQSTSSNGWQIGLLAVAFFYFAIVAPSQTAQPDLQQQYDKAQSLQSSGDMEQAVFAYKVFIASAVAELAEDRSKIGDNPLAAKQFEESLALHPNDLDLLLRTAQAERDASNPARAQELAQQLLTAEPRSAEAHALLGSIASRSGDPDSAVKEYEIAVAIDPSIANGFALAKAYLMKKDENSAAKIFTEMLASAGDNAAVHLDIGRTYGETGYPDQAIIEFKRALVEDPKLPGLHYSLGASYLLSMGEIDFPKAAAEFHKELALHPDDFLSHSQLGYIAVNEHNYREAEKELRRAAELNPRDPDTQLSLGQLYVDTNRPREAESVLRQSIALTTDPSRNHYQVQRAHYLLGRVLMQTGHTDAAKAEMQTSTDLLKLSTLQNQGKSAAEIAASEKADHSLNKAAVPALDPQAMQQMEEVEKRLSPAIADSYNNVGAIAAQDGDFAAAVSAFQHAAEWNPHLEGLDYNLGRAAYSAKDYAAAVAPLGSYLQQHPKDTWFRSALGVSLFMTGSYHAAVETLQPIGARLQASPQLASIYAAALVESGDVAAGIARLQQLEAANPDKPEFHRMLGRAWLRSGDNNRAEQELRAALRLDPSDTDTQHRLAQLEQAKSARPSAEPK
ncbi:tetratricopeptide (TPR) repeat protein [Silvibacterium bohemicum]|uniref:Tetratricopeptide (TPR) repeat protein n=1 Tax=Silvibacterium bohemicum TaxID=1577686 RepID=A0A841JS23_9BACT|nr:tetratricopeptide repeat protein [Silvibacterium bohemicum]MBB6143215.1 tetratricopeptide (TPR) repeat protein [Silvibacterium bohemicum]